ncbi:MAG: glycine betaine/L-proline ABC transporter ATP-binding protein [Desulfococcaceae bacterium]
MAKIEVENLYKVFGPRSQIDEALQMAKDGGERGEIQDKTGCTVAVRDVTFTVEGAEIFVIMGLSGSGKSTLLRCVNRLMEPTDGQVHVDEEDILALDHDPLLKIREKKMAMVFQHFGLLSHKTVLENAAFGLELANVSKSQREEKGREALEMVGLEKYGDSMVGELSGGMQQRVGLARALATDAEILLMDEAFSALDPLIRADMQDEFLELQKQIPKTILFITHDLSEALKLGDRIAIMKDGAIIQIGAPEEIVLNPEDDYVAAFVENVDRTRVLTVSTASAETQPAVESGASAREALEVMKKTEIPFAFVLEDGRPERVIPRWEAEKAAESDGNDLSDLGRSAPEPVDGDDHLIAVLERAAEADAPLPIVDDDGRLKAVVTQGMLLRAIAGGAE